MSTSECKENIGEDGNTSHPPNRKKQISASKHWCFTFNNYTEVDITDLCKMCKVLAYCYIFQEEVGAKGTKHLQGYIEFIKRTRPKSSFSPKIHWEKCRNIQASREYCCKSDTACGRQWVYGIRIPKPLDILVDSELFDWQKRILETIKITPNKRDIHWFWETVGGIGKSVFCKYLCAKYDGIILGGKASDMKYGIIKYFEKHKVYPELIVLDIPRSSEKYISYTGIEEVKNGCFFSSKYECGMVLMNCPHVIIFANFEPDEDLLSKDRWKVTHLGTHNSHPVRVDYGNLDDGLEFDYSFGQGMIRQHLVFPYE